MRFALIAGAKAELPVLRLCRVLDVTQSDFSPGGVGQPDAANLTTSCCYRMSDRPRPCRKAGTAVTGSRGNCGTAASGSGVAVRPF